MSALSRSEKEWLDDETEIRRYTGPVALKFCDGWSDWWCIVKAKHDGVREWRPTEYGSALYLSERLSDSSIEGPLDQMRDIADAIRTGDAAEHCRCAVAPHDGGFVLWSPRNDYQVVGWVTAEAALALAEQIERAEVPAREEAPDAD